MRKVKATILGMGWVLIAAWGCGEGAPPVSSSTEEATVRGTVTVEGSAPEDGTITFDPSNINRKDALPRSVKITKNGTFELKTLVGENSVTVSSKKIAANPRLAANQKIVVVNSGENNVPIELR